MEKIKIVRMILDEKKSYKKYMDMYHEYAELYKKYKDMANHATTTTEQQEYLEKAKEYHNCAVTYEEMAKDEESHANKLKELYDIDYEEVEKELKELLHMVEEMEHNPK